MGNPGNTGELTFHCSSHPHFAHYFLIKTDYPILPAKFPFYPRIRVNGILIREIWDAYLVVSFVNVTWSYIFRIVI